MASNMNGNLQQDHDASVVSHIYQSGFQQGIVLNRSYRLHCLILSQSPYLEHLIRNSHNKQIYIPLEQLPYITEEAFAIALGYLYASTSINLVSPSNARSVLATGCLLGGMEDLCVHAYDICKATISVESIYDWLDFLGTIPFASTPSSPSLSSSPSPSPLLENALISHHQNRMGAIPPTSPTAIFGPYAARLREDVFAFLVVTLPEHLSIAGSPPSDVLISVYARLPFDYFKAAVESPDFPIGSDQERFRFAKAAISVRKQGIAREAEETVVLAFGGVSDGGSAVHITRKLAKRRLWKVGK
ncbi:hypothetical protein BS47DRAFT_1422475 [Hydnum rufescens UP504]|uniref:BTB domain-containing protein n=1 Tax=Hydnum rufescens UP504 TaxID=1448309 RepID=A0A9P6B5T5_9AGAM|nr:hypothetical protein BS47DRAFT_1422475 [Hydnum rufescens UP504]